MNNKYMKIDGWIPAQNGEIYPDAFCVSQREMIDCLKDSGIDPTKCVFYKATLTVNTEKGFKMKSDTPADDSILAP